jgi:hypothetical protein
MHTMRRVAPDLNMKMRFEIYLNPNGGKSNTKIQKYSHTPHDLLLYRQQVSSPKPLIFLALVLALVLRGSIREAKRPGWYTPWATK